MSALEEVTQRFGRIADFVVSDPFFAGDYAPNYRFRYDAYGLFDACVVDGTIMGLLIDRGTARYGLMPFALQDWVAFLGEPDVISWSTRRRYRILHWPQHGVSVNFELYADAPNETEALMEYIYLYPFRDQNYATVWPMSHTFMTQPYMTFQPEIELETFDFEGIHATNEHRENVWPSATPRPSLTPRGSIN